MSDGIIWGRKDLWDQTSLLAMLLANANRDPKKKRKPYTTADFDPYEKRKKKKPRAVTKEEWQAVGQALKAIYQKNK